MASVKARQDQVILRPREDLDRKWNSSTIITPDSALTGIDSLEIGERRDAAAVCEVVDIGPGSEECPDMGSVRVGDVVVVPLYGASKVLVVDKEIYITTRGRGLAGIVRDLGKPTETLEAVNDYVLTRRDRDAFEQHMNGGLLFPEAFLTDGMPCDSGDCIVRVLLERVVHCGGGHWETDREGRVRLNPKRWRPSEKRGDLVGFNPLASVLFRRNGVFYHLVPFEDVSFALGE